MARLVAARSLRLIVVLGVSCAASPSRTAAQPLPGMPYGSPPSAPTVAEPVHLPDDVQARQRLAAAHDYIKAGSWPEAVRLLQALLDAPADSFRRISHRDKHGKFRERWSSIRTEAEQLLAELPKAGKDFYRLTYEARARKQLDAARALPDLLAIQDVARRYRYTRAGTLALEWLGAYYLDRGHADLASAYYSQLLRHPGPDQLAPMTLFKAALAARTGNASQPQATRELFGRVGNEGLVIGKDTYRTDKIREMISAWPGGSSEDHLVYRGDSGRSGQSRGDSFVLQPQWRIATAEGEARQWLWRAGWSPPQAVLPAAAPLALDGKLIYRTAGGLRALDAATGRPLWQSSSPLGLESLLLDPGKKAQLQNWLHLHGPGRAALVENSALGTLSSDGRLVYAVEDLPLPPPPELLQNENGIVHSLGPLRHAVRNNRLRALDSATGKVVWEIGGATPSIRGNPQSAIRNPQSADPLIDAYFLGPPLPLGGQLFALVEKQQELNLLCLDAERGTVCWKQLLATAREKMLQDVIRHTQAAHLAFADGLLVCPTHSGAILGVDPLSRRLVWAFVYAQPPPARMAETPDNPFEVAPVHVRSGWKGCAPIAHDGRVVFAPPDDDGLYCLHPRDGSLVWKATRNEEDLYVGCVHKGRVLIVGKAACRALSLATGETLWQRPSGVPAGQGVAVGSLYYLPLKQGVILALNLEKPDDSARIEPRGSLGTELGNLVFHRGVLWSQGLLEITALTPLTNQLARIEERLARSPRDPSLLSERGRLRQNKGDLSGAVADWRDALANNPPPTLRSSLREQLFAALTQLLQRDFGAGEKYLEEYRQLCWLPIPAETPTEERPAAEKEQRCRQIRYLTLVALGREKQGRYLDAVSAYRELSRRTDELMTPPEDPAVQIRPDLWVQGRVATLFQRAGPPQRKLLAEHIGREWQTIADSTDPADLRRFLTLFGAIEGEEVPLIGQVRLRLVRELAHTFGRRHALEAEFLLHGLLSIKEEKRSSRGAHALSEHARLLTLHGLLDEATACYRRLAQEHAAVIVEDGKTGRQLFDDLRTDKRFLPHGEPPDDRWNGTKFTAVGMSGGVTIPPLRLPCVPCRLLPRGQWFPFETTASSSVEWVRELPEACRRLRFTLDAAQSRLRVADRTHGTELYTIAIPLAELPPLLRESEIYYQAVDHLLVLCVGPTVLGVDLFERRVRWSRRVTDGLPSNPQAVFNHPDGRLVLVMNNQWLGPKLGLTGPVGRTAVCILTPRGLIALDPLTGSVRWQRSDVPENLTIFGDEEYLFLVESSRDGGVRGVRAVRARDGVTVPIPDATAAYAGKRRILGRHLLVADPTSDGQLTMRLYDPLTGKDVWQKTVAAGSLLLQSPELHRLGIVEPKGSVRVIDLKRRQEIACLTLDARHLDKVTGGHLLADHDRFYIALQGPVDPALKIMDGPNAGFLGGLTAVPVNGMLYAFDRQSGELRWFTWLPAQMLLLEQFEELPILLCSAFSTRTNAADANNLMVAATRSLDKRTGKLLYNREVWQNIDPFHTLRIDPKSGAIDLLGTAQRLRHIPVGAKNLSGGRKPS